MGQGYLVAHNAGGESAYQHLSLNAHVLKAGEKGDDHSGACNEAGRGPADGGADIDNVGKAPLEHHIGGIEGVLPLLEK